MKLTLSIAAALLMGSVSSAHAISTGYRTLSDYGLDGIPEPGLTYNSTFAALQKGDPGGSGTYDREFYGFIVFNLSGITSLSSAILNVGLSDTVTINPGQTRIGVYGQVDQIDQFVPNTAAVISGQKTLIQ